LLRSIPATPMHGGPSKGLYFNVRDLPADRTVRDRVLLAVMGSPDLRESHGVGGFFTVGMQVTSRGNGVNVTRSALLRTARRLMSGEVFVPSAAWKGL
jgi:2-methylaconitate cis-trans-isomerase PrpF